MEKEVAKIKIIPPAPRTKRGRVPSFDRILKALKESFRKQELVSNKKLVQLRRAKENPIIKPTRRFWEAKGTFNAGVAQVGGKIHILYRAFSRNNRSTIGYAVTKNGFKITERLRHPVYISEQDFKPLKPSRKKEVPASAEDPRLVKIGSRIYMSYTIFAGDFSSIKVALTSISVKDFLNKKWNWSKPILMTDPNKRHKNLVLFPQKIKGKFAILTRISPKISIKYIKNLEKYFNGKRFIEHEYKKVFRKQFWDSWTRGAGPAPIKTRAGWLVLYHAIDKTEPFRFKLGAMILDSKNPTKILYRSSHPILAPDAIYENIGKPGIVYSCGAIVKKGVLFVYYGGADRVLCVATVKLKDLIKDLKEKNEMELERGFKV